MASEQEVRQFSDRRRRVQSAGSFITRKESVGEGFAGKDDGEEGRHDGRSTRHPESQTDSSLVPGSVRLLLIHTCK